MLDQSLQGDNKSFDFLNDTNEVIEPIKKQIR